MFFFCGEGGACKRAKHATATLRRGMAGCWQWLRLWRAGHMTGFPARRVVSNSRPLRAHWAHAPVEREKHVVRSSTFQSG